MRKFLRWKYVLLGLTTFWLTICLWQAPVVTRVQEPDPPIRGVWLTNYGASFSYYLTRLDELTANLAKHHINTLYPAVWNRGNTLFASEVMKAAGGGNPRSIYEFAALALSRHPGFSSTSGSSAKYSYHSLV